MNKLFFYVFALTGIVASAQITKNPGDFTSVKVYDRISVELIQGKDTRVEIKGSNASEVEVINKNGELRIGLPAKKLLDGENTQAIVYYQKLVGVDATEGSYISSNDVIKSDVFDINAKEKAEVKLKLDVGGLKSRAVTGAVVILSGNAELNRANAGTGGSIKAIELKTNETIADVTSGGSAYVWASEKVKATTKAGGEIQIHGNPREIDQKSVIGGTIKVISE